MKKTPLKKLLSLILLVLVVFSSCEKETFNSEKENNQEKESKIESQYLRGEDVPEYLVKYLGEQTDNTFRVNIQQGRIHLANANLYSRDTPLGTVQTNKVIEVVNERNIKYTFKVSNPADSASVVNLIVVDVDGEITEYFIQYLFDELHPPSRLESGAIDMTTFTGRMLFYDYVGLLIGDYDFTDGVNTTSTGETNPCPPDDDTTDSTNDTTDSDDDTTNTSSGTTSNSDGTNTNSGATSGSSSGTSESYAPGEEECGLTWSYESCGCGGSANGHGPQGVSCCQGSPLVVTDTCTGQSWSSRNNTSSRDDLSLNPCAGDVGVILDDEECLANLTEINQALGNNLTPEFLNCISQDCESVDAAASYLNANPTETNFVLQAVQNICDGEVESFEEYLFKSIVKFDTTVPECLESIILDLMLGDTPDDVDTGVTMGNIELIDDVFAALSNNLEEERDFEFTYKTGPLTGNGRTRYTGYNASLQRYKYEITISDNLITNGTKLALVKTVLHESIHAYLKYMAKKFPLIFSNPTGDFSILLNAHKIYSDVNDPDHVYMASLITDMASNVSNFVQDKYGYPTSTPDYYEAVCWSGITHLTTGALNPLFVSNYPNFNDQQNIIKIFNTENGTTSYPGYSPLINNNCN